MLTENYGSASTFEGTTVLVSIAGMMLTWHRVMQSMQMKQHGSAFDGRGTR